MGWEGRCDGVGSIVVEKALRGIECRGVLQCGSIAASFKRVRSQYEDHMCVVHWVDGRFCTSVVGPIALSRR